MNKLIKIPFFFFGFVFCVLSLGFTRSALAQSVGLSAIPPRLEITGEPGTIITKEIKIRNESNTQKTVSTTSRDFIVVDDKGTPVQLEDGSADQNRWAASSWIQVSPTKLTLKPGETRSLVLTLIVPEDALPGGHYAMILHSPNNEITLDQTGASIQTNVGTLVYVTVPGDIKQDATVTKFTAPSFSEYGPINFDATIANFSDIHITPVGSIIVKNWFGGKTSQLTLNETNIFPYTTRDFASTLEKKWLFGRYTAQLSAAYGTSGQVATAAIIFWVLPWRLMLMVLAAIIIIVTTIKIITSRKPTKGSDTQNNQIDDLEKELEALKKKYQDK
jgi:hypothetical protein